MKKIMININEARRMMPSCRMDTILEEVEALITDAAKRDKNIVVIPEGFFGEGAEHEMVYNVKHNELYEKVKGALEGNGFQLGRKDLKFYISWK